MMLEIVPNLKEFENCSMLNTFSETMSSYYRISKFGFLTLWILAYKTSSKFCSRAAMLCWKMWSENCKAFEAARESQHMKTFHGLHSSMITQFEAFGSRQKLEHDSTRMNLHNQIANEYYQEITEYFSPVYLRLQSLSSSAYRVDRAWRSRKLSDADPSSDCKI
jgi:hypothetical protein